jgi:antitoxin component HigA of HigAB toxin-antitoxin module
VVASGTAWVNIRRAPRRCRGRLGPSPVKPGRRSPFLAVVVVVAAFGGGRRWLGQLLRKTLPHAIRTNEECQRLTAELLRLDELENASPQEQELAELLTVLIDEYEERRYPIARPSPQQTLQHLMAARNLNAERSLENIGLQGHHLRGVPRPARDQQGPGEKARGVSSRQRGIVHLEGNVSSSD